MKIVYTGPNPGAQIAIPGGSIHAARDVATEVPNDLAKRLLEQDTFEAAKPAKEKP